MARLGAALADRLATRGVTVLTGTEATDLVVARRPGRRGSRPTAGTLDADVVVCAVDPRRLPALAAYVVRTMPAIPPVVVPPRARGRRARTCRTSWCCTATRCSSSAPAAARRPARSALTVHGRGRLSEDILRALARHRIDVRAQVVDPGRPLSPRDQVERWGGSPLGVLWQGRATVRRTARARAPRSPGVYAAGAHATPGAGLPFVGLSPRWSAAEVGRPEPAQTSC